MKRFISIILSALILVSALATSALAFAKDPVISPETTSEHIHVVVTLHGKDSNHTSFHYNKKDGTYVFKYTGSGNLIGWDFDYNNPPLVEGVDYEIISQEGNTIVIKILPGYKGEKFWVNAVDDLPPEGSETERNNSQKSPNTGDLFTIATCSIGLGMALVGITKKRK